MIHDEHCNTSNQQPKPWESFIIVEQVNAVKIQTDVKTNALF